MLELLWGWCEKISYYRSYRVNRAILRFESNLRYSMKCTFDQQKRGISVEHYLALETANLLPETRPHKHQLLYTRGGTHEPCLRLVHTVSQRRDACGTMN